MLAKPPKSIERYSEADVPTEYGSLRLIVYREGTIERQAIGQPIEHMPIEHRAIEHRAIEHMAIVKGEVAGRERVPVRVHSECFTGEVLHSKKCDCREQLDWALRHISEQEAGAVIYLRQEGRGIGLGNKIRAYALQEQGVDTVDANRMLGFEDDPRTYHVAADILEDLEILSIVLMTNNPEKVEALEADEIEVCGTIRVHVEPNEHSRDYLLTKRARMGHWLSFNSPSAEELPLDAE